LVADRRVLRASGRFWRRRLLITAEDDRSSPEDTRLDVPGHYSGYGWHWKKEGTTTNSSRRSRKRFRV
jgi:hypothetical protein